MKRHETFDVEELLETSEEHLYLPSRLVKFGDGDGGEAHVVGQRKRRCLNIT